MRHSRMVQIAILAVVLSIMVGITVYSDTIPPISVVASESMQHSTSWEPGIINTGDMVFIRHVQDPGNIVQTYVTGSNSNFSSYGEYGNVIIYTASNGDQIVHRPLFYLYWHNGQPEVQGYHGQGWITITSTYVLLKDIGYAHRNIVVYVSQFKGIDGYITAGDYNLGNAGQQLYVPSLNAYAAADQDFGGYLLGFYDPPVNYSHVVGIAYGYIPWLGLIKLEVAWTFGLEKQENPVPSGSLEYLGIVIAAVAVIAAFPYDRVLKRK